MTEQEKKETRDTGGLTANNNHAGGVEDLRNHAVVKSSRPKRESAQSADRFVGKYLDRKARAPTANRRSRSGTELRSGVGGARRGVREYSAVNYHKVELTSRETRKKHRLWPWRGGRYEETSNVVVAWTTQSRRPLETHPLHAQRAEEGSEWC